MTIQRRMKTPEKIASDIIPGYPNLHALIADAIREDRAQLKAILDMDDEEVGDYNEWGDVQRVFMLREALGMDGDE